MSQQACDEGHLCVTKKQIGKKMNIRLVGSILYFEETHEKNIGLGTLKIKGHFYTISHGVLRKRW